MKKIIFCTLALILGGVIYMSIHQKVHVVCENMCLEEGMTKEQIETLVSSVDSKATKGIKEVDTKANNALNGVNRVETKLNEKPNANQVLYRGNFAIVTGKGSYEQIQVGKSEAVSIPYPTGFNKDNCVVLSVMLVNPDNGIAGYGATFTAGAYMGGAMPASVRLRDSDIYLTAENIQISASGVNKPSTTKNFKFKIVLMKLTDESPAEIISDAEGGKY